MLELTGISKHFVKRVDWAQRLLNPLLPTARRAHVQTVRAVDGVDLTIKQGEVVGLVGESGCGKSTLGRIAVGLLPQTGGVRAWQGCDVAALSELERRKLPLAMQMIFQDPYASLNPRRRVLDIVTDAPVAHGLIPAAQKRQFALEIFSKVGLSEEMLLRYPHQFSGGQRARVGIARALAVNPAFIVCDESVAALDVSIQAQIINLFMALRQRLGLTYLFISHDLGVVQHIADRVVVMYLGRVVEEGGTEEIFAKPLHPYLQALLREIPKVEPGRRVFRPIQGELPSPLDPPPGCHFHPRCPHANEQCRRQSPTLRRFGATRQVACHRAEELSV